MMTQQEFDAACVDLRTQRQQIINNIKNDRLMAHHEVQQKLHRINADKEAIIRDYRNEIYDLATTSSTRSAAFVAGQAEARNRRDTALAELDAQAHKLEEEFFQKSQSLSRLMEQTKLDFDKRKADIIREYDEWVAVRRQQKAEKREGGAA